MVIRGSMHTVHGGTDSRYLLVLYQYSLVGLLKVPFFGPPSPEKGLFAKKICIPTFSLKLKLQCTIQHSMGTVSVNS